MGLGGDQISRRKHEELLGIVLDHKLKFENHRLKIVQKVNQKIHALARISNNMPQKTLIITMETFVTL